MILYTYLFTLFLSLSSFAVQAMDTSAKEGKQEVKEITPVPTTSTPTLPILVSTNPLFREPGRIKSLFAERVTRPYGVARDVLNVLDEQLTVDKDPVLKAIGAKLPLEHHACKIFDTRIKSCTVSPNGKYAVVSRPGLLHVFDIATQKIIFTRNDHKEYLIPFALSKDNQFLAYGTSNGQLVIVDFATQAIRRVQAHTKSVTGIAFNNASTLVASGSDTLRLWDITTLRVRKTFQSPEGTVTEIEFHSNDRHIRIKADPTINFDFSPRTPYQIILDSTTKKQQCKKKGYFAMAFHPNQPCIAFGHGNGNISLHNLVTNAEDVYAIHHGGINTLAFTADGKKIVSAAYDGHTIKIWDLDKHELVKKLKLGKKYKVKNCIVTPLNIIALDDHAHLYIWDHKTCSLVACLSTMTHKMDEFDMPKLFYTPTNTFICSIVGSLHTLDCKDYLKFFTEIAPTLTLDQRWLLSLVERKLFAEKQLLFETDTNYKNFSFKGKYLKHYRAIYACLHPVIRHALAQYAPLAILQEKK